jgi:hypothetical protein
MNNLTKQPNINIKLNLIGLSYRGCLLRISSRYVEVDVEVDAEDDAEVDEDLDDVNKEIVEEEVYVTGNAN